MEISEPEFYHFWCTQAHAVFSNPLEVVLSVLLQTLTFASSGKQIRWVPAPVFYPAVGNDSMTPQMPLEVGLYKSS